MNFIRFLSAFGCVAMALAISGTAYADGAVAVALPSNIARDGVAIGIATDEAPDEVARTAMQKCRERADESKIRIPCSLVGSFKDKCAADALDPKAGTPGFGWAIASTSEAAEREAISKCRQTSRPDRRSFCRVGVSTCDGSAK